MLKLNWQDCPEEGHYKRIDVQSWQLYLMFAQGAESHLRCELGIPEGGQNIAAVWGHDTGLLHLIIEHPDFPLVKKDEEVPLLPVQMTAATCSAMDTYNRNLIAQGNVPRAARRRMQRAMDKRPVPLPHVRPGVAIT